MTIKIKHKEIQKIYSAARSWRRAAEILSARTGLRVDFRSLARAYKKGRDLAVRDKRRLGTAFFVLSPEDLRNLWQYIEKEAQSLYWSYGDWAVQNAGDAAKDFLLRLDVPGDIPPRARLAYARRAVRRFLLNYKRDCRWEEPIDPQETLGEKLLQGGAA